ncbi:MarR family winged helix-turn-helix transcriptional regulator [Pseudonocardia alaniniphila]|uniref:MarR family winged helix-turn-helix transcriptional regulator n=1 Tax=Pseudonocardia alaniniphila TaxID=75291 RepID=A0ABS9TN16_9PSEU|nr:MarR family winged helix-turn-helix transcriptional regulator [Pseudonocardia alaniniphila]MCH6169916.1 MarR family winged helix-turn-helix transcriptional regulator [Pseudonocardia alaniniphila]
MATGRDTLVGNRDPQRGERRSGWEKMAGMADADEPTMPDSMALLLVAAGQLLSRRVEDELAALGLTLRHYGALGHLAHRPDMSYSDLARRAGITSQSMHATVRMLEQSGAVKRTLPGHGHAARLEVTDHGRRLLAAVGEAAVHLDQELFAHLTDEQRSGLRAGLLALAPPSRSPRSGPSEQSARDR